MPPVELSPNRDRWRQPLVVLPEPAATVPPSARRSKHGPQVSPIQPSDSGVPIAPHRPHRDVPLAVVFLPANAEYGLRVNGHHGAVGASLVSPRNSTCPRGRADEVGCGR